MPGVQGDMEPPPVFVGMSSLDDDGDVAPKARLAGMVPLGSKPETAAADGRGHVFVNMQEKDTVTKIDLRKLMAEKNWATSRL